MNMLLLIFRAYRVEGPLLEDAVQMLQYLVRGELSESAFNWMEPVGVRKHVCV